MQDNYPQEFDEQFIDEAWLKMHQLLDKEMPVQPKRRAAWWLWLLAGLLLLVILGGAGYYLYHSSKSPEPSSSVALPTASLEGQVDAAQTDLQLKGQGLLSEQKSNGIQNTSPGSEPATTPEQTRAEMAVRKVVSDAERQGVKPILSIDGRLADDTTHSKNIAVKEPAEGRNASVAPPNELVGSFGADKSGLSPLAFLPEKAGQIRPNTKEIHSGGLPQPTLRKPAVLKLAAEGGAYFFGSSAPNGLSAGLAIETRPRESRLYLRTGAFFCLYKEELKTEENMLHLENTFSKAPQPDGSIVNSTSKLSASSTITAARYMQFPLTAGFQWRPRLSLEGGLQAGVLLSNEATSRWRLIDQPNTSGGPRQEDNTIFEFKNGAGNDKLNPASLGLMAGIVYRPGLRTSLRLSYQHGLSDVLASSTEKAYIRRLHLSLAYYIIQ